MMTMAYTWRLSVCQAFLEGHNNIVSTLAISHDGTKLASGEIGLTPGTKVRRRAPRFRLTWHCFRPYSC